MTEYVRTETTDDVTTVTLADPERQNALSIELARDLRDAVSDVEDSDARCLVVRGAGGAFCAGGDIEAMQEALAADAESVANVDEMALPINRAVQAVAECPVPTVAKVDGPAFGAGGALAIACDVVLASDRAKISFGFRHVGLSVDSGTSALLPRVVGVKRAKELVFTGEVLGPDRARQLGLFNHVYPAEEFDERADDFVERVASGPTVALEHSKQLLEQNRTASVEAAIESELAGIRATVATADHAEGVAAFFEGREPDFDGC